MSPLEPWTYDRDECWGPDGAPMLSASLRSDDLVLTVRNSRRYQFELLIATRHHNPLYVPQLDGDGRDAAQGAQIKIGFDDGSLHPFDARVQKDRDLAFIADGRRLLAMLQCANRVRLHARTRDEGRWLKLDVAYEDLELKRLVEPKSQIFYGFAAAQRTPAPARSTTLHQAMSIPEPDSTAAVVQALLPVAGLALGYKLGNSMTAPKRKD